MKYLLIMNPGSRSGKSGENFKKIFDMFDKESVDYQYRITKSLDEAYKFSVDGNLSGYDVIVAVGGDGTINRVLNGFYDSSGRRLSGARFGVIYTGTSPDFCRSYGIPLDIESAVKALFENKTKTVSVGRIVFAKAFSEKYHGKPVNDVSDFEVRYFACCSNIGLGAALARRANSGIRGVLGDTLGTFISLIRTLMSYTPTDFTVCFDGKPERIQKVFNISIGKTFYIASGIKVKNDLKCGDQRFYSLTVKNMKIKDLPGVIKKVYGGDRIVSDGIISLDYIDSVEIYGNSQNPEIEFDGDPGGFLPCSISTSEGALEVICSIQNERPGGVEDGERNRSDQNDKRCYAKN